MKITKKTREQAALICAAWASSDGEHSSFEAVAAILPCTHERVLRTWSRKASRLAQAANYEAGSRLGINTDGVRWRERFAEAEALLRTGWSP